MKRVFFESKNSATRDFPYFSDHTYNINYLSHFHREIELVLVRSGSVDIVCENRRFTVGRNDICVFMPGEIHSFISTEPNHLYILKLDCHHSVKATDCSLLRVDPASLRAGTELNTRLYTMIEEMHGELLQKQMGYEYLVSALSNHIIGTLLRFSDIERVAYNESKKHLNAVRMLDMVNEYIEKNYEKAITLDEMAKQCSFSKYYFSHFFKDITGATFYEYLTLFRLEKARTLLLHTEKKVSDIALDAGFSNIRSFNRAFKEAFEKTPSAYKADILASATSSESV